ncbi:protein-disulfide reductase DsbD [Algibacillus agarilyticus]|uniref:protein-disulfide reductase DsbD n=1 Tax=Algibacillus agarilyticus TaxID=2234133 RepID=UPI000DD0D9EF|nr:protein-disulfide reductase DsbD [Algibacillus agarilyticus]
MRKPFSLAISFLFLLNLMSISISSASDLEEPLPSLSNSTSLSLDILDDEPEFLDIDQAFAFEYQQTESAVTIKFTIAEGYYLYKKQFKFKAESASIGVINLPVGILYQDEYFGETEIFKQQFTLNLPLNFALSNGEIKVAYQGCAEAGLCYPPSIKTIFLNEINTNTAKNISINDIQNSESDLNNFLQKQNWYTILLVFFVLGIGLALTPCVFPMYPILSSILVGQEKLTNKRAFALSVVFVQGMALTYALLGLAAALAGASFHAILQSDAMLITLSIIFIALAGAMFGLYELQLPSSWVNKLNSKSQSQKQGSLRGALIMGVLSGLIASPCTTAPLSGALLYVAQTGDALFGFITLYILSLGMGLPLLIIGASSGKWLPKAGGWMENVKKLFAFILLAVPLTLASRFLAEHIILWLATGLTLLCAIYFSVLYFKKQNRKFSSVIVIVMLIATGYLTYLAQGYKELVLPFYKTSKIAELNLQFETAINNKQPVMLDITADWCSGCKEFEHLTFANSTVQSELANFVWLQLDVTEYNAQHDAFIKSLNIVGPPAPTVLIYDPNGIELSEKRIRGFLPVEEFIEAVKLEKY